MDPPEAGVTGDCEPCNLGARKQTQVVCRNNSALHCGAISPATYSVFNLQKSQKIVLATVTYIQLDLKIPLVILNFDFF